MTSLFSMGLMSGAPLAFSGMGITNGNTSLICKKNTFRDKQQVKFELIRINRGS
jgi:hypothetical protein